MEAGGDLDERLRSLESQLRALTREMSAVIITAEENAHYAVDGFHSAKAWVKAICNVSDHSATERVRIARAVADLPALADALAEGSLGVEQAAELSLLHKHPRCRPHLPRSIGLLVEDGQQLCFVDFRVAVAHWRALADPDGTHRSHENARSDRRATAMTIGTSFLFHAEGDTLAGTEISKVFQAFVDAEFNADWTTTREQYGEAACARLMPRSHQQRCFDAFHAMTLAAAGSGKVVVPVPLVSLVSDVGTFINATATLFGQPTDPIDPTTYRKRRCETVDGVPIDSHQLVAAAIIGRVRRVMVDSAGRVLELGRRQRLFRGGTREAVLLADFRCTHPGCSVPATSCHIDHLVEWARNGGLTSPGNGGPRCGRHNHDKTRLGLSAQRDERGQVHTYRPDGTEIAPRQPPQGRDDDEPD